MPLAPPRLCPTCNRIIPAGERCACQKARRLERNRRFERTRPSAAERGYDSRWTLARRGFLAKHPRCTRCGDPATVVDHIRPHRGDRDLFWQRSNWQPLCQPCHNRAKQREERRRDE